EQLATIGRSVLLPSLGDRHSRHRLCLPGWALLGFIPPSLSRKGVLTMWFPSLFGSRPRGSRRTWPKRGWRQPSRPRRFGHTLHLEPLENRCLLSAVLVKDVNAVTVGSFPTELTDVNGTVFFVATDATGRNLWKSDGTEAGTELVKAFGS